MSHHYVTDTKLLPIYSRVAIYNFCPWPLPTSHRIILPVTHAQTLRSSLCPTHSVLLPRRIGRRLLGVSHSSQSRSHVSHLISHHYLTHLMSHHYVTDTKSLPMYSRMATFNCCPWPEYQEFGISDVMMWHEMSDIVLRQEMSEVVMRHEMSDRWWMTGDRDMRWVTWDRDCNEWETPWNPLPNLLGRRTLWGWHKLLRGGGGGQRSRYYHAVTSGQR